MPTFKDFASELGAWSLVAAKVALKELVETLLVGEEVERHAANVSLRNLTNSKDDDGNHVELKPDPRSRTMLAVAVRKRPWSVVYRTLGWCEGGDSEWTRATAMRLAAMLDCESIGCCCGDHGMGTWLFDGGDLVEELPPERPAVHKAFQARKISLPICFVGTTGLYADVGSLPEIEEVDEITIRIVTKTANTIDFIEFPACSIEDIATARRFYGGVFGWTFRDWGDDYIDTESSGVAVGFNADAAHRPSQTLPVIYTNDLKAARSRVVAAGGSITREIFSFPGGRRFHFRDPVGNEVAVWSDIKSGT